MQGVKDNLRQEMVKKTDLSEEEVGITCCRSNLLIVRRPPLKPLVDCCDSLNH